LTLFKSLFVKIGDTIGDSFDAKVETGNSIELTEAGEKAISKNATLSVDVAEFTANNVSFFEELDGKKICVLTASTRTDAYGIPDSINLYKPCTYNYSENLGSSNATVLPFVVSYNNVSNKNEIKLSGIMNADVFEPIYAFAVSTELLYLVLSKNLDADTFITIHDDLVLLVDDVEFDISTVTIDDKYKNMLLLPLKDKLSGGEVLELTYTKSALRPVYSSDGDLLDSFADMSVVNDL
jgi:hypothetical protein